MISVSINEKKNFPILEESASLKGTSKNIYIETQNFPSLLILEKFKELTNIQGIALIGSSASGKSTLMKAIRLMSDDISIPKRFITRPQRLADDLNENIFISFDDFQNKIKNDELPISWMRKMEGDRIEYYGFEKTESKSFPIYSANNDFSRQIEIAKNALQDSKANNSELTEEQSSIYERIAFLSKTLLILGVYAPDEIRQKRLNERSPDLATSEREYRIKDSSDNIISRGNGKKCFK